ncbi:DUF7033 domain-containing protein [Niabella ginsengisoli]|uniref:DUF7033 domain-containing protein n=1 Tax=Niabella ginsengisoli TaxID=522298 RepID=A0ABS9SQ35_9BACT|nr:hypothetical protein [Niabella ginsengisoli]MCH5600490.1 hypothetical protein [Niabella ginsengisoli]
MLIFSTHTTPRLQYIVDFISKQISNEEWFITNDEVQFASVKEAKINYSNKAFDDCLLQIQPHNLLFEEDIKPQSIICIEKEGVTIFFRNESETGFDIFAASFYLISRYEEYLPHKKDKHGRYSHENALAFQQNFLQQPLVNIWLQNFRQIILKYYPSLSVSKKKLAFYQLMILTSPGAIAIKAFGEIPEVF